MKKKKNNAPNDSEGVKDMEKESTEKSVVESIDDSEGNDAPSDTELIAEGGYDDELPDINEEDSELASATDVEPASSVAEESDERDSSIECEELNQPLGEADSESSDVTSPESTESSVEHEAGDERDSKHNNLEKALGELKDIPVFVKNDPSAAPETMSDSEVSETSIGDEKDALIGILDEKIAEKKQKRKSKRAEATEDSAEESTRKIDTLFDFLELFVFTLAAVLIITAFFVRHSVVDGDSMLGTLHDKENLLISDLFYDPKPGDIVVVEDFSTLLKKPIVKRVIAVGGQTVRIQKDGVYVDGEKLVEDYVFTDGLKYEYEVYPSSAYKDNDTLVYVVGEYYEFTVPEGELFIMGDHRNESTDSRHIGTVDEDAVLGRVILRFYPFDKFGTVD